MPPAPPPAAASRAASPPSSVALLGSTNCSVGADCDQLAGVKRLAGALHRLWLPRSSVAVTTYDTARVPPKNRSSYVGAARPEAARLYPPTPEAR